MMKTLLLFGLTLSFFGNLFAQAPPQRTCGTMQHHNYLLQTRPNYQNDLNQYEQVINQYLQDKANGTLAARASSSAIITIPVVVHVLYNGAAEDITDAQAASQVQVLNDDFAKLNADAIKVTQPTFSTVASGANIRFCLAQRDPNGNATTGVIHKATTASSFNTNDNVKHNATGGDDAWDVTRYVNIWVCDLGSSLLGYGEFPTSSLSNTWGLVIHYKYTGSGGSAISPYNLGRTGTHEFGHCFNLFHIWGDDGTACSGSDQCSDTPNQADEHYGCFTQGSIQTDACSPSSPGVMWMNYMDYTNDACMYMFTAQQCARMEAVVNTAPWNVLATSNGCTPVTALDAGISSVLAPANGSSGCVTNVTPRVTLVNAGSTTLTSARILYKMDATATQTLNWSGTLASASSTVLTLNAYTGLTTAAHTFSVWVTLPNNGTDQNTANNSMVSNFTVTTVPTGSVLPFTEGFETTTFPPAGWQLLRAATVNTVNSWSRLANTTGLTAGSTAIAKMDNYSGNTLDITNQLDALRSPALDFSAGNTSLKVRFDVSHRMYNTTTRDSLMVYVSTDCANTWTRLYAKGGSSLATVTGAQTSAFTPTANVQWRRDSISLSAYAGQPSVYLKFESKSAWGNNLYLDNINVRNTIAAAPTASFASVPPNCPGNTIALTDQSQNGPTSWAWSMPGASPATSTAQNPSVTYTASGTYTISLTATNSTGSSTPYTQVVTINPRPTVTVASSTVCAGVTATITASGAASYSWNTGQSTAAMTNAPAATTVYTVTGTSAASCTNVATGTITVKALPTVTATSATICAGANAVITAGGASTYTWTSGPSTANYTVTPAATTVYTVTGTGSNACVNTRTTSVTVNALPTTSILSATICSGATATLSASGANTYAWNTGATGPNLTASPSSSTNYTVTGTSAAGCVKTATGSIVVGSAPAISLSSATLCAGGSVVLSASGVTTYTWTSGPNTATYSVSPSATTVYTVSGNLAGCSTAAVKTATVTVNNLPNVTAGSATICAGNTANLSASGASSYAWDNGATTANTSVNPSTTTSYIVTGTSAQGCVNTATATVLVNVLPNVSVSSVTICAGSAANLSASGAFSYVWNTGATSSGISVSPSATTMYTVTGTSAQGCTSDATAEVFVTAAPAITVNSASVCAGSSAILTASGVSTYTWNTGSTAAGLSVSPSSTTVYTVTGNLSGCSIQATQTATVTVYALPAVNLSTATDLTCVSNGVIALTGTPAGGSYSGPGVSGGNFNPNTAGAGSFTVTYSYTNNNNCTNSASKVIVVELCTGLEEINGGELVIYPNPAKETLTVKFGVMPDENATVELYDAIGKLVVSQKAAEQTMTIDVRQFAKGIYTLRIVSGESQVVRRIVKE